METDQTTEGNQPFVAHVPVPSQKEVCSGEVVLAFWWYKNSPKESLRLRVSWPISNSMSDHVIHVHYVIYQQLCQSTIVVDECKRRNSIGLTWLRKKTVVCDVAQNKWKITMLETRTVTGSELFLLLNCPHTTTFTLRSIFSPLEMSSTNIWETILS